MNVLVPCRPRGGEPWFSPDARPRLSAGGGARGGDQGRADVEAPDVSSHGDRQPCDGRGLCAVSGLRVWEGLLSG